MAMAVQVMVGCLAARSLKAFNKLAASHPRAFFNDPETRTMLFDSGIMSAGLDVLGVMHGIPALRPDHALFTESPPVRPHHTYVTSFDARLSLMRRQLRS